MSLDLKKEVTTRAGSKIKIYEAYNEQLIGAWYDNVEDRWVPTSWTLPHGYFLPANEGGKHFKASLDLINNSYYEPQTA